MDNCQAAKEAALCCQQAAEVTLRSCQASGGGDGLLPCERRPHGEATLCCQLAASNDDGDTRCEQRRRRRRRALRVSTAHCEQHHQRLWLQRFLIYEQEQRR
eukprot:6198389-Pleurochrysis_carterae.AAC.1